jgi:hypothetical protein
MRKLLVFLIVLFMAGPAFGAVVSSRVMPAGGAAMWDVRSFGGATRQYNGASGLADWELDVRGDLTGAETKSPVLECYDDNDGAPYDLTGDLNGFDMLAANWTTSATKFPVIMAAAGESHGFQKSSGVLFRWTGNMAGSGVSPNTTAMFNIAVPYAAIYDLAFTSNATFANNTRYGAVISFGSISASVDAWTGGTRLVGCYIYDCNYSATSNRLILGMGVYGKATVPVEISNCLFVGNSYAINYPALQGSSDLFNCTFASNTYAVRIAGGAAAPNQATVYAKNVIMHANTANTLGTDANNIFDTSTTCAIGTPDSGVSFVDAAAHDYNLKSDDTVAINEGTDLEAASTVTWNDDGNGIERGNGLWSGASWDIGALEYATGGAVSATLIPAEAIVAGAQWRVDGGDWKDSEAVVGIAAGTYTVDYKDASGYTTPGSVSAVVADFAITEKTGEYVLLPSGGGMTRKLLLNLF